MSKNANIKETKYFSLRNTAPTGNTEAGKLPPYVERLLPENKEAYVLDVGCGFGNIIKQVAGYGFTNVMGIDISEEAVSHCTQDGLNVEKIDDIVEFCQSYSGNKFDLVVMTHVIEHLPKKQIIETLEALRSIMASGGTLYIATPNAQAASGAYWAYEDFTHEVLFTTGSIEYVLKAAGFSSVDFLDPDNIENSRIAFIKKMFIKLYKFHRTFWDKMLGVAYHPESLNVYAWELKISAKA